jgi:transposase
MLNRIQESIHTNGTLTMERLIAVINDEFQVKVCSSTIDRAMKKLQYSFDSRAPHIKAVVATDVSVSEVVVVLCR